jgi:cytochrome o ubiquinol oxidase subunit IV
MSSPPENPEYPSPLRISSEDEFDLGSRVGEDRVLGQLPSELSSTTLRAELGGYLIGLALAVLLSAAAFFSVGTQVIYAPGIVMAVVVFGLAQVGVHLVFFLHMTTAPDNTNNALALAFGFLIVCVIVFGTIWVMHQMDHNMMPTSSSLTTLH